MGFTRSLVWYKCPVCGPSPRAWGLRNDLIGFQECVRSIPTCVGFTGGREINRDIGAVHPHVRGVYVTGTDIRMGYDGPSPRAWGLRITATVSPRFQRSIPTCVGFTRRSIELVILRAVHPHVRGVYKSPVSPPRSSVGPSPRAWGLRRTPKGRWYRLTVHPHVRGVYGLLYALMHLDPRSIPTCVGFTGRF